MLKKVNLTFIVNFFVTMNYKTLNANYIINYIMSPVIIKPIKDVVLINSSDLSPKNLTSALFKTYYYTDP